jgi:hypothetical protein
MEDLKSTAAAECKEATFGPLETLDIGKCVFGQMEIEGADRESRLASIYEHFLMKEIDPFVAFQSISAINETRCIPPLPPNKVSEIVLKVTSSELQDRKWRKQWPDFNR